MTGEIRAGIVGLGVMGRQHAKLIHAGRVPGLRLAAVCDVCAERLAEARAVYGEGVRGFAGMEQMLDAGGVDAVIVATRHFLHPAMAGLAFERGLHVLVEKPAGVYTRQVREMNEVAARSGRTFGIMLNQRTRAVHRKLKELIDTGELGELIRVNWIITSWFRTQSYYDSGGWRASWAGEGGGVLLNQCPHNLDLLQWFCGMPRRVRAFCGFGRFHDIEVEDDVTAYLEFPNGATGVFVTSTGDAPGTNRLELSADRGKAVLEDGKLTFWRTRRSVRDFTRAHPEAFARPECWRCEVPLPAEGEEHLGILKNWTQSIREGVPLIAPGSEGIRELEISNAMHLSAWTDAWAELPVDEDKFLALLGERVRQSSYRED